MGHVIFCTRYIHRYIQHSIWKSNKQEETSFMYMESPKLYLLPRKQHLWACLSITTNNMLTYHERRNRRWWLLATKLAIQIQLKVLYTEVSGRTSSLLQYSCMMPQIINIGYRWDATHATEAPITSLISSRNFGILWWSAILEPCPIVFFGLLLFQLDKRIVVCTQYRVQKPLAVETLNCWAAYIDHTCVQRTAYI